ncbi:TetR/AcrR family transcriptional regulator [Ornithinibacillus massiliensis]|uniref:TetR/AcrR family transcriptional regulator n=1 Tax=Ornithinibacillus massiliensis TaxID=1944633 RepID=A0ABS5MHJ5_9BACI|nr:TetR/AcrR family transcriptional regulator [Ornithinibacillus massiliensis]MBS3681807.1 TetR/AcrR family transcriptional regulator [Ornithinibacillus massiliensis]
MHDRIIQEAINLIHEKGFSFTISDLVRNLGTSKRTIYQYFDSKDSIIEAIIEELISEIKLKEQHIYNNEDLSLIEKIRELLICIPEEFQIMDFRLLIQLKKLHYNQWEKLNNFISHEWDIVIELIERGINEGAIRKINIQLFIELYLGAINQIYDAKFSLKNRLTMSQILNSAIDILLNGIYVE